MRCGKLSEVHPISVYKIVRRGNAKGIHSTNKKFRHLDEDPHLNELEHLHCKWLSG